MPIEFEYRYFGFNKKNIVKKIRENGGKKKGVYLFKVMVMIHPLEKSNTYIRVRDEGYRITMTYKTTSKTQFQDEHEVIIDDFDSGCNILFGIGCKKKYYYEKIREIWNVNNSEVVFDTNPGRIDIMEIESNTKKDLINTVNKLGLKNVAHDNFMDGGLYKDIFGIIIPRNVDLTFKNMEKILKPLCTNNRELFIKLIKIQKDMYKKLIQMN